LRTLGRILANAAALAFCIGCHRPPEPPKQLTVPADTNMTMFAVSGVAQTTLTNRNGKAVPGLLLRDASLVRNASDLALSHRTEFVIFQDFLLGNLARGRYWEQQAEKRSGPGLPAIDTRLTRIILVSADSNQTITASQQVQAAHVRIAVDTNDFGRQFAR